MMTHLPVKMVVYARALQRSSAQPKRKRQWKMAGPLLAFLLVIVSGCSTHYYKREGDQLAICLEKNDVHNVVFASSLDGFQPHSARKTKDNWIVLVPADTTFSYYYLLDGTVFVPSCRLKEKDDFGSQNCVFEPDL